MATPQPNAETVEALLDTTWRMSASEAARTDALDRKASTLASFASVVIALTGSLGLRLVDTTPTWWAALLLTVSLVSLACAVGLAVKALFPREYLTLGMDYLRRFPTWSEILKPPEQVRGETMRGLIEALARERAANDGKSRLVKGAYVTLGLGLAIAIVDVVILAAEEVW